MKILLFYQDWFAEELKALGHEVISYGNYSNLDLRQSEPILHLDQVLQHLPNDFDPEVLIFYDDSLPIPILGLYESKIPRLFYSVDCHHHTNIHKYLAECFSYTLIAQKDYIADFKAHSQNVEWLPLWASQTLVPSPTKSYSTVFVGTLNPALNPARVKFFSALQEQVDVHVVSGNFADIYPKAKIILNQTVKQDLNFRVFEALSSGALLITERTTNGLTELFNDKSELILYESGNVVDAANRINYYLANPEQAEKIGAAGRQSILQAHLPQHRASKINEIINQLHSIKSEKSNPFAMLRNYCHLALQAKTLPTRKLALNECLRLVAIGLENNSKLDADIAADVTYACLRSYALIDKNHGKYLLQQLATTYDEQPVFELALIVIALQEDDSKRAAQLAARYPNVDKAEIFRQAQAIISEIIAAEKSITVDSHLPA